MSASSPSSSTRPSVEFDTPPIASSTPRPSVAAAMRRGSFYGDATPRASIADILAANSDQPGGGAGPGGTDSASSLPESDASSTAPDIEEEHFMGKWRVYAAGFLHGLLERFELMALLPGANVVPFLAPPIA